MPKFFNRQFEGKQPKRINENVWFKQQQKMLLWMANTDYGRDLLCIDKRLPKIIDISKKHVTGLLDIKKKNGLYQVQKITDFRIGAKWANVIRYRWPEFQRYAQVYYAQQHPFQFKMPVFWPVAPVPGFNYVTTTVFPDPDPETTSVDGHPGTGADASWSTMRNAAGNIVDDTTANDNAIVDAATATTDVWNQIEWSIYLFDTASIPDTDTIDATTLSIEGSSKNDSLSAAPTLNIYSSAPASNTGLVIGDYTTFGTTAFATGITFANWSVTAYNEFTFNATGRSNVSKTGVSKFGLNDATYFVANSAPTWVSGANFQFICRFAETAGTGSDPKLVVTHSAAAAGGQPRTLLGIGG